MPKAKPTKPATAQQRAEMLAQYQAASPKDFMLFVRGLKIESEDGPVMFENVMAHFQRDCFADMAPSIHAVRNGSEPPIKRFWLERTKKAGKDSDLAATLLWLIAWPIRPFYGQVGAADREQAGIIKRRVKHLLDLNKWMSEFVVIQHSKIKHTGGLAELDILSADTAGSHGEAPNILVINELAHVRKSEFLQNLRDNADGVRNGIVVIATNAGFKGTMADKWRQHAIGSEEWSMHIWKKPAPWHSKAMIAEAKARDLGKGNRFRRLWKGQWQSGKGEALDEYDINRCFAHGLGPLEKPLPGWIYLAGLDLGVSHDHSGLVVVGVNERENIVRVVYFNAWEPELIDGIDSPQVDLIAVENACLAAHKRYGTSWFGYDPWGAQLMAQRLRKKGVPMHEVSFASNRNLTEMAETLVQFVENQILQSYDDDDGRLRRDLGKFEIAEKTYGYRLQATSDEFGHADIGTALVITLPRARMLLQGGGFAVDDFIADDDNPDDQELTQDEVDGMDDGLRDVHDYYADPSADVVAW